MNNTQAAKYRKMWINTDSGAVGYPKKIAKGSGVLELFLWVGTVIGLCFFLVPGLIIGVFAVLYSLARACRKRDLELDGSSRIVRLDTPGGRKLFAEFYPEGSAEPRVIGGNQGLKLLLVIAGIVLVMVTLYAQYST